MCGTPHILGAVDLVTSFCSQKRFFALQSYRMWLYGCIATRSINVISISPLANGAVMTTNRSLLDRNDPTRSHIVTYGRHIGRVGALAAALGIGLMVATSPGVASADSTSPDSTSPSGGTSGADSNTQSSNTGTTDAGTTSTETGTAVGSSAATSTTGTGSSPSSTTTDTTKTSSASSSSIQVAPGVTISANSIKIGSKTVTLDLGAEKTPTSVKPPVGEVIEPSEGSAPPVVPTPETGQTASSLLKTESKSTHAVTGKAATAPLTTAVSKLETSVGEVDKALKTVQQLSAELAEASAAPIAEALKANTASNAITAPTATAAIAPVAPTTQAAAPSTGAVGFLNQVVTNLLKPFLAPTPNTPGPVSPVAWAVLGWVRRNQFNQAPTITYDPASTTQTGQTVTGTLATDPNGDALTYTVTGATKAGPSTWVSNKGTLTIDQATNTFTYTPNDINYNAVQTDSFTVSVTDGKLPNGNPIPPNAPAALVHGDTKTINITVQPPTITRVILNVPGVDKPWTPRYSADGKTIYFTGTPTGTTRSELYQINSDGTGGPACLSCGLSPDITPNLFKPVPTADGSGRVLVQLETASPTSVIYEPAGYNGNTTAKLVKIVPPPSSSVFAVSLLNEPRISPDGKHILFSRIELGQGGYIGEAVAVGDLVRRADGSAYDIVNSKVVGAAGEGKNWTADGKGVICLCGLDDQGNADNVIIDLATGEVTRLNANLDYDEDMDLSPNEQWMAVGSLRGFDGLTPMSRIQRPATLPTYIQAPVYYKYAIPINISNQEWLVRVEDDLDGENGIPLYALDDRWTARSMPSFNADGSAVTFWEYNIDSLNASGQPTQYRLVVANLENTTSVGTVQGDVTTPALSSTFPSLTGYVVKPPVLPGPGTYTGAAGGTYTIAEVADPDPMRTGYTLRTVTYNNYVNEDGMILNGTESTSSRPNLSNVYYLADIRVTGTHTGVLKGDATVGLTSMTGHIPDPDGKTDANGNVIMRSIYSTLDGETLYLLDDARYQDSLAHT